MFELGVSHELVARAEPRDLVVPRQDYAQLVAARQREVLEGDQLRGEPTCTHAQKNGGGGGVYRLCQPLDDKMADPLTF